MRLEHLQHLSKDKTLKSVLNTTHPVVLSVRKNIMLQLCYSIMSQQLSTKVAKVIHDRFTALFNGKIPTSTGILALPFEQLKSIGLSSAKAMYIQNVCRFFSEQQLTDAKLKKMSDEEILACLCQIKGVGKWTVEMILMFAMGREDVFAVDDLGIQQQMISLYKIDTGNKKEMKLKMLEIAQRWAPYRTYACRYLWNAKDSK